MGKLEKFLPWLDESEVAEREERTEKEVSKARSAVEKYERVARAYRVASIIVASSSKR